MSEGPIDQVPGRQEAHIYSPQRFMPSVMSDNMSFRSTNYQNHVDGLRKQIEEIKFR